ncbi:hypothetical protein C1646_665222 [Rhizophagus diaphanus]|nr:hypothetical protein C1646_665222 [Rhizophagus diaphanus] [Rhizophagus sp. MUCL 43196]
MWEIAQSRLLGRQCMVPTASHGTCCLVYTNPRSTQEGKSSIEHQRTMSQVPVLDSDPRELIYYINRVGFNHVIIVGETEYGMIFLDCYGRVLCGMMIDESPMLWLLGNSLEEVPKQTIKGKDVLGLLGLFVKMETYMNILGNLNIYTLKREKEVKTNAQIIKYLQYQNEVFNYIL